MIVKEFVVVDVKVTMGALGGAFTIKWWVTESCPKSFSTLQEYSPASVLITSRINREPSGCWRILSLELVENFKPLMVHVMTGGGTPTARQGSVTSSLYVVVNVSSKEAVFAGTEIQNSLNDYTFLFRKAFT